MLRLHLISVSFSALSISIRTREPTNWNGLACYGPNSASPTLSGAFIRLPAFPGDTIVLSPLFGSMIFIFIRYIHFLLPPREVGISDRERLDAEAPVPSSYSSYTHPMRHALHPFISDVHRPVGEPESTQHEKAPSMCDSH